MAVTVKFNVPYTTEAGFRIRAGDVLSFVPGSTAWLSRGGRAFPQEIQLDDAEEGMFSRYPSWDGE